MKKILITIFTMFFLTFTACAQGSSDKTVNQKGTDENMNQKLYITIGEKKAAATLEENVATKALVEKLKAGRVTYSAHDYGGFEKVGDLGFSLPTSDRQITSQSGDIFLYVGSSLVFFYGSNSWSYTKIGTLNGMSKSEVREFLQGGKGEVNITLSLE
ncbi:MAG: hypothetical protein MJZ37_08735 [Bacilli bacterium]|nr:hypothetical protein [Bacilli bacterium]